MRIAVGRGATAALALLAATCSSPTNPGPVTESPIIQSISPLTGPVTGGTTITIRGAYFASGAAVSIGGQPATDVVVEGASVMTAKTPAATVATTVDVAITLNGRTATLPAGFRYEPALANTAPIIRSITAQGTRTRQPANFADYGETIQIAAVVEDAETPADQLSYQWQACGGLFTGVGRQVQWRAPTTALSPGTCLVELIVSDGPLVATGSTVVRLHDSPAEVGALALEFLTEFATNSIPAAMTVRNFSSSCSGKNDELEDVTFIRDTRTVDSYTYGTATVTVAFGGMCKTKAADACVLTPVEWRSTVKATGTLEIAKGTSIISGVYRDSRWWLCDSLYDPASNLGLHFMR